MSTSTIEARRAPAKRLGVFLVGVAVACAGAFSLSTANADAVEPFQMSFDKGAINLGAAFKGQEIMPAPKTVTLNGVTNKAAYWWDAADTGYAAAAAKTWADTVSGGSASSTPPGFTPPYPSNVQAYKDALYAPLAQINACITNYAAAPEKPDNLPSQALPNLNFPCEVNPPGGTIGATQAGWAGQTPGTCLTASPRNCFTQYSSSTAGIIKVRNWPGPINTNPAVSAAWNLPSTGIAALIASNSSGQVPAALWGAGTTGNPNTTGNVPFGFLDMVIPVSQSSQTEQYSAANDTRTYDIKIGANAFRFPLMVVPSPVDGSPVPITLAVTGAPFTPTTAAGKTDDELYVKGSFNPNTGEMSLSGALEARVLVGLGIQADPPSPAYPGTAPATQKGGPTPFVYCAVPLEGLKLNTTGSTTESGGFPGMPYYDGTDGEGAIAGKFNITKDSTPTVHPLALAGKKNPDAYTGAQAPNCATVNTVTKGEGALWLGSGEDIEPPVCAEDEVGNYPDCKAAQTAFAKPTVKVAKSVKAGKKLKVTIRVKNNGTVEGTANVRVQTSNAKAKAPTLAVKVNADPGKTGSKTVNLSTKRNAKGKVTVYATVSNKTGKANTKIK